MITLLIIIVTALFSIAAFKQADLKYRFIFSPYQVIHRKQWYRVFSAAFLHANWEHLIFNMLSFYFFAPYVEARLGIPKFLIIYFGAIVVSSIKDLVKHKDNHAYSALGASGAVSAIIFTSILLNPTSKIMFILLPIPIPAVIFGLIYLAYSYYMGKKSTDNIGHDAHFWGAIFGFVFPILLMPSLFSNFINQLFSN
ncbi:MAG: rhomboid family intramembrane serine protease [Salinivirgaceae bacterium]|nr:rhomboid family intramembrane serine protease [Salinivirgaceae bacterium]